MSTSTGSIGGNHGDSGEFMVRKFDDPQKNTLMIGDKKVEFDVQKGKIIIPGVGSYTVSYGGEPIEKLKNLQETVMGVVKKLIGKIGHELDLHNLNLEIDKEKFTYQPKGSKVSQEEHVDLTKLFIRLQSLEKGEHIEDEDGEEDDFHENSNFSNYNKPSLGNVFSEEDDYSEEHFHDPQKIDIDVEKKN